MIMMILCKQYHDDDDEKGGLRTVVSPGSKLWVNDTVLPAFSLLPPSKAGFKNTYEDLDHKVKSNQPDNPVGLFHIRAIGPSS